MSAHKRSVFVTDLRVGDIIRVRTLHTVNGSFHVRKYPDDPAEGWFRVTPEWIGSQAPKRRVQLSDGTHARFIR